MAGPSADSGDVLVRAENDPNNIPAEVLAAASTAGADIGAVRISYNSTFRSLVTAGVENARQLALNITLAELLRGVRPKMAEPETAVNERQVESTSLGVETPSSAVRLKLRMGDRAIVSLEPGGIYWTITRGSGKAVYENRWPVITGRILPKSRRLIEGQTLFEVEIDGQAHIDTADGILRALRSTGQVVSHKESMDALSVVLRAATDGAIRRGHAAVGVYADSNGRLGLDIDPFPLRTEQGKAADEMRPAFHVIGRDVDVDAYRVLVAMYERYESLPTAGLAVIAPFAYALRQLSLLIPHDLISSSVSGLGKSHLDAAFSEKLYLRTHVDGNTLRSAFRLAAVLDSWCGPIQVEEIENVSEREVGDLLKESAERASGVLRGNGDQRTTTYANRATFLASGQVNPLRSEPVLVRFIARPADASKKSSRVANHREFDQTMARLRPIGFDVIRHTICRFPTVEALADQIRIAGAEIEAAYAAGGGTFRDARRPGAWAAAYVGLGIWESYAAVKGTSWLRPSLEEFVQRVVARVETATFAGSASSTLRFARWFNSYRATQRGPGGAVRGDGSLFREAAYVPATTTLENDGPVYHGWWVGTELVTAYDDQADAADRLGSLATLARGTAETFGFPIEEVARAPSDQPDTFRGRKEKLSKNSVRVAFIPENFEELAAGELAEGDPGSQGDG